MLVPPKPNAMFMLGWFKPVSVGVALLVAAALAVLESLFCTGVVGGLPITKDDQVPELIPSPGVAGASLSLDNTL